MTLGSVNPVVEIFQVPPLSVEEATPVEGNPAKRVVPLTASAMNLGGPYGPVVFTHCAVE
jgi:hypothetical protein